MALDTNNVLSSVLKFLDSLPGDVVIGDVHYYLNTSITVHFFWYESVSPGLTLSGRIDSGVWVWLLRTNENGGELPADEKAVFLMHMKHSLRTPGNYYNV